MIFNYDVSDLLNKLAELQQTIETEVSDRVAAFDNLHVGISTTRDSLAAVVSAVSALSSQHLIILRLPLAVSSTFLGKTASNGTIGFFYKASDVNSYYLVFNRDAVSVGNLSLANSTVTVAHSFISSEELAPMLVNESTVTIDNISISSESTIAIDTSSSTYSSYKPSKTGYKPIAISGFTIGNADTDGANYDKCSMNSIRLSSSNDIYARIINHSSSGAAKVKLTVYILWAKNS